MVAVLYCLFGLFALNAATLTFTEIAVNRSTPTTGDTIQYRIKTTNETGSNGVVDYLECVIPSGFVYVSGTTKGWVSSDPSINGNTLTWTINKNLKDGKTRTLRFNTRAALTRGTYSIDVTVTGSAFDTTTATNQAPVTLEGPILVLSKLADKGTILPGDSITYTINYQNTGDDPAYFVFIMESIPPNTEYLPNSASGNNMDISYSENGGSTYGSTQSGSVTDIMFERTRRLNSGASGSVSFRVKVK